MQQEAPLSIQQIPKFEFELKNQQLVNCIKELTFNMKNQQKNMTKIKKDLQSKINYSQIVEMLVFANTLIEVDPALVKQLKSRQKSKQSNSHEISPINKSSSQLGKKVNQISQVVTFIHSSFKQLDKKVTQLQFQSKSSLSQKCNALQEQIDQNHTKVRNQILQLREQMQIQSANQGDKIREVQTKTLWQINDCKMRLNSCINDQYVKDSMRQLEGKLNTRIKQEMVKQGSIDPDRIYKIESQLLKNQKQVASQITELSYKISALKDNIQSTLVSKKQQGEQKIQLEKRFSIFNNNLGDVLRRLRQAQTEVAEEKSKARKSQQSLKSVYSETERMNEVLKNLKIGDDFQKMLQKMDPHKICELDQRVQDLTIIQQRTIKNLDLLKGDIDRIRSKTEFCNILTPNTSASSSTTKTTKQQLQSVIHEYLTNNMLLKKIQNLQSQILDVKAFPDMVNNLNKQLARVQKQTDTHNINYELKGLQQYIKKQILIVNNRINNLQMMIGEQKKKRPSSAGRNNTSEPKLGSSVSYKKLTPANCISCYPSFTDRKGLLSRKL